MTQCFTTLIWDYYCRLSRTLVTHIFVGVLIMEFYVVQNTISLDSASMVDGLLFRLSTIRQQCAFKTLYIVFFCQYSIIFLIFYEQLGELCNKNNLLVGLCNKSRKNK